MAQSFQRGAGVFLARVVEFSPAVEATRQPRGDLWIERIERADPLGKEAVALAALRVEMPVIGAEGA
ncbi:hypothetical protein AGMMS50256_06090 [Betaproteobacteria bacterium]|nr:hypothetical protein AGMMS50256_06090 [Betaproteobacteria bacterium]